MNEVVKKECELIRDTWTNNGTKKRMVAIVDNQTLALALSGQMMMTNAADYEILQKIWLLIERLSNDDWIVQVLWAPRETNTAADALCHIGSNSSYGNEEWYCDDTDDVTRLPTIIRSDAGLSGANNSRCLTCSASYGYILYDFNRSPIYAKGWAVETVQRSIFYHEAIALQCAFEKTISLISGA